MWSLGVVKLKERDSLKSLLGITLACRVLLVQMECRCFSAEHSAEQVDLLLIAGALKPVS